MRPTIDSDDPRLKPTAELLNKIATLSFVAVGLVSAYFINDCSAKGKYILSALPSFTFLFSLTGIIGSFNHRPTNADISIVANSSTLWAGTQMMASRISAGASMLDKNIVKPVLYPVP